jgi:hypothetical protein
MTSSEIEATLLTGTSGDEEAARLLLRSGFSPGETMGQVKHKAHPHRAGRTLGSVWLAMRRLLNGVPTVQPSRPKT